MTANRRIVLVRRPEGPLSADCFRLEEEQIGPPQEGWVEVAVEHISIDAFIRTVLYESAYHAPVPIGGTVSAIGVGRVSASAYPGLAPGDAVVGQLGVQTRALLPAGPLQKVDPKRAPLSAYLGALGITTGMTAYFGVRDVGAVQPGDVVVVSAAAGAVGSVAAQIAKILGGHVIGIAGGPGKCAYLTDELGLEGAIDYRGEDVAARLDALAPEGIDVFFDNVGGEVLDLALERVRERARVVICGAISQYDDMDDVRGPKRYLRLAEQHARMEGFAVTHFASRFDEAREALEGWLASGELVVREHVFEGVERFPEALLTMFGGDHIGKLIVNV